jgi:glyoxalase family protein
MATQIGYLVPEDSIGFWQERFERHKVFYSKPSTKFGELSLAFVDPDGLHLEIVASKSEATRKPWATGEVSTEVATRVFTTSPLRLPTLRRLWSC